MCVSLFVCTTNSLPPNAERKRWHYHSKAYTVLSVCFCLEHNTLCIGTSQPRGRFIGAICTNTLAETRPRFARVSVLLYIHQSARNTPIEAFSLQIHVRLFIDIASAVSRAHFAASVNWHLPLINLRYLLIQFVGNTQTRCVLVVCVCVWTEVGKNVTQIW